ncbi:MAG: hypothetical protein ACRDTV_13695, partial [Mycobacterium sp.]
MAVDVAARLSEGRPAVQHTQTYVAACAVLGYRHPDLTAHGWQVRDWYETEAGLDLGVLDDDCAALWAAVTVTEDALASQRAQLAELAAAWRGPGADCAMQFLRRHCDAAALLAARVRAAAEGCAALRDNLWRLVDGKVATAIAIDDRRLADRPAWLAAAHTVATGAGDRSTADAVIREQVNPYVDNDIRIDWLATMRSAVASVDASFDAVTDGLAALPAGCFELVGDFGPSAPVTTAPVLAPRTDAVLTVPAAAPPPPPPLPAPAAAPADPLEELAAPPGDATGLPGGISDLGGAGGLGGLAGSVGSLVGSIVEGIGGVLGSLADGLAGPELDDSALQDPFEDPYDEPEDADDADDPVDDESDENDTDTETAPAPTDVVDDPIPAQDTAAPAAAPDAESQPPPPPEPTPP